MRFCKASKKSGAPCNAKALEGFEFCSFHEPSKAEVFQEGRRQGGKEVTRKPHAAEPELPRLPLKTKEDVVAFAADAANRVRSGTMGPKQGTAIGSLLNVVLGVLKAPGKDDDEKGERPLGEASLQSLQELARALTPPQH